MALSASSNWSSFHCSKLKPFGDQLAAAKYRAMMPASDDGDEMLSAIAPCRLGASGNGGPWLNHPCHSTTSKSTLTPQASLRFCCRNSFIGSGSIWPEPELEICTLNDSGLAAVKPASASI